MKLPLTVKRPQPPSPARSALAEAVRAAAENLRQTEALRAAVLPADQAVFAADRALKAATAAVDEAKGAAARHLAARMTGDAGPAPPTVQAARADLQEAEDALDAARAACAEIKGLLEREGNDAPYHVRAVRAAALAVLRDEGAAAVDALVADVARLQRELYDSGCALAWLLGSDVLGRDPPQPALSVAALHNTPPQIWALPEGSPAEAAWRAAFAALLADPAAPAAPAA